MPLITGTRHKSRWCIGIDPGVHGGIAFLLRRPGMDDVVCCSKMPDTYEGVWELIWENMGINSYGSPVVFIEQLTGHAGPTSRNTGSSSFKLGRNVGLLMGCIRAVTGCFPQEVHSATWQKLLGIEKKRKGEEQRHFKARLKEHAQGLFPDVNLVLWNADALLLAEYAYGIHTGLIKAPTKRKKPAKRRKARRPRSGPAAMA